MIELTAIRRNWTSVQPCIGNDTTVASRSLWIHTQSPLPSSLKMTCRVSAYFAEEGITHIAATEHQKIRVFGDDPIDVAFPLEVAQLCVCFVGCNDVVDVFCPKRLHASASLTPP